MRVPSLMLVAALATAALVGCSEVEGDSVPEAGPPSSGAVATGAPRASSQGPGTTDAPGTERCFGRRATITGTKGADHFAGTRKRDVIVALDGEDVVENVGGGDVVCAGDGQDVVRSARRGAVYGVDLGPGDDRASLTQSDQVRGGPGDDRIVVDHGFGNVSGGPGHDYLRAVTQKVEWYAENAPCLDYHSAPAPIRIDLARGFARGEGRDRVVNFHCLIATHHDDEITGSARKDGIRALSGADLVYAGAGNDSVDAGPNADQVHLGPGHDYANGYQGWDRLYGDAGPDTLEGWSDGDYLDGGAGNDQIYGALFCSIGGNTYDTAGLMDGAGNELFGGPGDDYQVGDRGNDRLDGGPGYDQGQGGYRDRRVDWITSTERLIDGCLTGFDMFTPFDPGS